MPSTVYFKSFLMVVLLGAFFKEKSLQGTSLTTVKLREDSLTALTSGSPRTSAGTLRAKAGGFPSRCRRNCCRNTRCCPRNICSGAAGRSSQKDILLQFGCGWCPCRMHHESSGTHCLICKYLLDIKLFCISN